MAELRPGTAIYALTKNHLNIPHVDFLIRENSFKTIICEARSEKLYCQSRKSSLSPKVQYKPLRRK